MKVVGKQKNSRMCVICGLDNKSGVRAPFYNMEDGSVMTRFRYAEIHQSYPGRVHGGLITAMLDEMGMRALWVRPECEDVFGVTMDLETKYRKPVPYDVDLVGRGVITFESPRFLVTEAEIVDLFGNVLANGTIKYIKLDVNKIAQGVDPHAEMCYRIDDGVTEL